jgi:hypothetical protein
MPSSQQTAVCASGYTGTGGGVKCQGGGYGSSWSVPYMDPSSTDSNGRPLVSGWTGACGIGPTTVLAVCCPACPDCTSQNYGSYGSYGSGSSPSNPPPPPPPAF